MTKIEITDEKKGFEVVNMLHELGPKVVIITSTNILNDEGLILLLASK